MWQVPVWEKRGAEKEERSKWGDTKRRLKGRNARWLITCDKGGGGQTRKKRNHHSRGEIYRYIPLPVLGIRKKRRIRDLGIRNPENRRWTNPIKREKDCRRSKTKKKTQTRGGSRECASNERERGRENGKKS